MTTKQLGNIGEAKTLSKFVEMMIPVYVSFGDNEKSDLIAEFNGKLNRIQCKSSEKFEDGKIIFSLKSSTIKNQVNYYHKYTNEEIDFFAVYNLESDILLLLPIEEFNSRTQVSFRVPYVKTYNQNQSLDYKDYTFEKIICVETLHEMPKVENN